MNWGQREWRQKNNFLIYHKIIWKRLGQMRDLGHSNIETPGQLGERWGTKDRGNTWLLSRITDCSHNKYF